MDTVDFKVNSIAFEGPKTTDRGYTIRASYLEEPHAGDALIEIMKNGQNVRSFMWPAYKIYNLQAHFSDIVDSEIAGNTDGYATAGWDGISGAIFIDFQKETKE